MSQPDGQPPQGTLRPTTDRALALCAVAGLVGGWALHPLTVRLVDVAPGVSWAQPGTLLLVAAIMTFLAAHTWRTVQVLGRRLEVHHAVNRLVLARSCALAGALVGAGYAGYAISWLGDDSVRAEDLLVRSVLAAAAAGGMVAASLWLERACRTPGGPDRP